MTIISYDKYRTIDIHNFAYWSIKWLLFEGFKTFMNFVLSVSFLKFLRCLNINPIIRFTILHWTFKVRRCWYNKTGKITANHLFIILFYFIDVKGILQGVPNVCNIQMIYRNIKKVSIMHIIQYLFHILYNFQIFYGNCHKKRQNSISRRFCDL